MRSVFVLPQEAFEVDSTSQRVVADAHNAMAEEYDLVEDLWYSWLFFEIHEFIALHLPKGKGLSAHLTAICFKHMAVGNLQKQKHGRTSSVLYYGKLS